MSKVSYTDNTALIKSSIQQKANIFIRFMADQMVAVATPNTPKATGRLRFDIVAQVTGLSGKVKWGKNYAIYQEAKQFKNYTTAGTGPHFAADAANQLPRFTGLIARRAGLI